MIENTQQPNSAFDDVMDVSYDVTILSSQQGPWGGRWLNWYFFPVYYQYHHTVNTPPFKNYHLHTRQTLLGGIVIFYSFSELCSNLLLLSL